MDMFSEKEIMGFNELEFEIYNFVLKNRDKIPYMTIRELALEAHVSTTTIMNFCKKVNCKGFSEFRIRFKIANEQSKERLLDDDITALYEFLNRASTEEFIKNLDTVSEVLENAKNLIFIGTGNSGVMAQYAARYFSSVGKFALHVENPMFHISPENPEDSVVIMFSVAGDNSNLVNSISPLKLNKTTVISVTNSKNSTIAKLSDYNISYYVQHELKKDKKYLSKIDITTQFPVVYIIETLAKKVHNIQCNQSTH